MGAVTFPATKVYNSAAQSIPHNVLTAMTFNAELYDTDTLHDLATNPTRFTVKTPGIYNLNGSVIFSGSTPIAGVRQAAVYVNGVSAWDSEVQVNPSASEWTQITVAATLKLAAGDYVEIILTQTSGAAINLIAGVRAAMALTWLGGPGQTVDERGVPAVKAYTTAVQSIPNATWTAVAFTAEEFDTDGMHDLVTNTSRFTVKTPGLYEVTGSVDWST